MHPIPNTESTIAVTTAGEPILATDKPASDPATYVSAQSDPLLRPVLVTTEFRGVFFGYASDTTGDRISLHRARNCLYWPDTQGGFGGLAAEGPLKGARIGARVPLLELRAITSVAECSLEAAQLWEAADVHRG